MEYIAALFKREGVRRIIILSCFVLFLYLIRSVLNLLLLTFIFTFLMNSVQNFIVLRLKNIIQIKQRVVVVLLYLALAAVFVFGIYKIVPIIVEQSSIVMEQINEFRKQPNESEVYKYIMSTFKDIDLSGYASQAIDIGVQSAKSISNWSFNIFISLILSLFFLLEKSRIVRFTSKFKNSRISFIYNEIEYFGKKFVNSFGKVIEAQVVIAFVNCVLSVVALWIMGFPQLPILGIMIFVLGLIPVAGVIISLVPLCLIAFSIGGFIKILYVLAMVAGLHALEAYFLNPKLMSSKTELPVFYTFIVLILAEHFIGVWGLIVGIPIFIFMMDLLGVKNEVAK